MITIKKMRSVVKIAGLLIIFASFLSCKNITTETEELVSCPDSIAKLALDYAVKYSQADTEYEYGGQDLLRAIKIDCSGLVVNCYRYSTEGTGYALPFYDAAVKDFYQNYSVKTENPRPGDLIFMGDEDFPTHISIFVKEENGRIYFIDSTFKPEAGLNGVSERSYTKGDPKFISFGILLLRLLP